MSFMEKCEVCGTVKEPCNCKQVKLGVYSCDLCCPQCSEQEAD